MGFRQRLANWLGGYQQTRENALIVPLYKIGIGEFQQESIRSCIDAYIHDPDVYNAVNFISNAALSDGFYVTGNEDYKSGKAIDLIEDFNKNIRWGNRRGEKGLHGLLRIVTKEMLYGGNTFIEMLTPNKLEMLNQVQLSSIYKIYRNEVGDTWKIQQLIGGKFNDLDPDNIIHIPWLQIDREPFGRGLIQPLIAPRLDVKGRNIPPLYVIKASLEFDVWRIIHRKGVPRSVFSFPEAGDELVQAYSKELKDPDPDISFATNTPVDIKVEQGGPSQGIANLLAFLDRRYQAGLQTPINNLLNSSGYTEASARVAEDLGGLIYKDLRLRLENPIEYEMYDRVLLQAGFDPEQAKIKLHWGSETDYEYTLMDLGNMFDRKLVTVPEARKILRKIGWELEDDSTLAKAPETITVAKGQQIVAGRNATEAPEAGLIQAPLNPQMQAQGQGLAPGQAGVENPNAKQQAGGS